MALAGLDFDSLRDLHNSANHLLHSPIFQQSFLHRGQEKWLHEVSEASLRMLDVCGISKDIILLVKEHLQDLQFTLRKVSITGEDNVGEKIAAYNNIQKKLKKETSKCLRTLKAIKHKCFISDVKDENLMVVVEVLKEVKVTAVSMVESLLSLICIPWLNQKASKGSFPFKLMILMSNQSMCEEDLWDEAAVQSASKRLEAVELAIEDLEDELECMFRRLIQTRVSLLNILTS